MPEISRKPNWESIKAAYESTAPTDEVVIISHRVIGENGHDVHVMWNLKEPYAGKTLTEAIINNGLNDQEGVDEFIDTMLYALNFAREELNRLRTIRAAQN